MLYRADTQSKLLDVLLDVFLDLAALRCNKACAPAVNYALSQVIMQTIGRFDSQRQQPTSTTCGPSIDLSSESFNANKCQSLAAYGSNATVAKTDEELEDRHQSLFGDADNADDINISMPSNNQANGDHADGDAGSNGQIPAHMRNGADSSHPLRVRA